ncbi:hypothetical protein B0I37DRAFT_216747, partial [Chaetomium sp. MPI-CAGE-AT-0009]
AVAEPSPSPGAITTQHLKHYPLGPHCPLVSSTPRVLFPHSLKAKMVALSIYNSVLAILLAPFAIFILQLLLGIIAAILRMIDPGAALVFDHLSIKVGISNLALLATLGNIGMALAKIAMALIERPVVFVALCGLLGLIFADSAAIDIFGRTIVGSITALGGVGFQVFDRILESPIVAIVAIVVTGAAVKRRR